MQSCSTLHGRKRYSLVSVLYAFRLSTAGLLMPWALCTTVTFCFKMALLEPLPAAAWGDFFPDVLSSPVCDRTADSQCSLVVTV